LVERLLKKGLLEKKSCKFDKRLVDVTITEKGLALLAELDVSANKLDNIISNLSLAEAKQLNELLDKARG